MRDLDWGLIIGLLLAGVMIWIAWGWRTTIGALGVFILAIIWRYLTK